MASAISTSPLGSTSIQRGWSRPPANALTLSPGAATGVCPSLHPRAVGIFRVGMLPCGLPAGIVGALPHAGSGEPLVSRRICSAAPPTRATPRAKRVEKLTVGLLFQSRRLRPRLDRRPIYRASPSQGKGGAIDLYPNEYNAPRRCGGVREGEGPG